MRAWISACISPLKFLLRAIQVGWVRRVAVASPAYLAARGDPTTAARLYHPLLRTRISGIRTAHDRWSFRQGASETTVALDARLTLSTVQAALDAAVAGGGVVRPLSYQSAPLEASGQLVRLLHPHEPPPIPIHLIHPAGRYLAPKVRLFIDRAVGALRGRFEKDAE
jgi:DNA-binding transcriptional LysR family regulator